MRTHDSQGQVVEFDREYLLLFGGRTYQKMEVDGLDLYLNCESILNSGVQLDSSLNSCLEFLSEELWRR
jgi:hypothetical protein